LAFLKVGYLILILARSFSDMASLIRVYIRLIRAWLAMMAAAVAMPILPAEPSGHEGIKWIGKVCNFMDG